MDGGTEPLTTLRPDIAQHMASEILECPIDIFLDHYAPFKPSGLLVTEALNCLKGKSLVNEVGSGDTLVYTLPKVVEAFGKNENESTVFKNLESIAQVLEQVEGVDGRKGSYFYKDCPTKNITSEIEGTNFRVDACITRSPKAKPLVLSDAAVIAEFKKANTPKDIEDVSAFSRLLRTPDIDICSRIAGSWFLRPSRL